MWLLSFSIVSNFNFLKCSFSVSTNMIELSTVEAAVQECSQSLDETMYGDIHLFLFDVYGR